MILENGERCPSKETLEFAHMKETGLNGEGRGQNHRAIDIKNHPDSYKLLCKECHLKFDHPIEKAA